MLKKLFYTLAFCLIASNSYANMLFSKTYIVLDGGRRSDVLEMTNLSSKKMRYRVKLVNYKQLPNGKYEVVKNGDMKVSADKLFYISPRSFILDNKQAQVIRVMRKSLNHKDLKDLNDGEYRTHLVVQEIEDLDPDYSLDEAPELAKTEETDAEGMEIKIKGYMGMSIPVIFRKGQLEADAKISSAVKEGDTLKVEVQRTGTKSTRGDLLVLAGNKEIGVAKNFAIYTENDTRYINIPLNLESVNKRKLSSIKVSYRDSENKKGKVYSTYTLNN